jgi:hypothetical protein
MRDKLGYLYFQYFEISSPYWRVPLMEKVFFFIPVIDFDLAVTAL